MMQTGPAVLREHIISGQGGEAASGGEGVVLRTLVSSKIGSGALSTGTATFAGGAFLPLHRHTFSEAITVVTGTARVIIENRAYLLGSRDSIHVPAGLPHVVRNEHPVAPMVAHWAFASGEPTRELLDDVPAVDAPVHEATSTATPENLIRTDIGPTYELSKN